MRRTAILALVTLVVGSMALTAASLGQQPDRDQPGMPGMGMPGMGMMGAGPDAMGPGMMGPGMMGSRMGMMGGACPMMGMMGMMGRGDMPMYSEGRIAFLKAELAITDAETKAWDAYADALKKNMQSMQGMHEMMRKAMAGKTPVERLDAHVGAMESRLQALKEIKAPLAALYDVLTEDQKKKADQLLTGMGCMV